jgi:hypothetical protein
MPELCARAALAHEALERDRAGDRGKDHLDRDLVAEQDAARAIDGTQTAFGDGRQNLVVAVEDLPDSKHELPGLIVSPSQH